MGAGNAWADGGDGGNGYRPAVTGGNATGAGGAGAVGGTVALPAGGNGTSGVVRASNTNYNAGGGGGGGATVTSGVLIGSGAAGGNGGAAGAAGAVGGSVNTRFTGTANGVVTTDVGGGGSSGGAASQVVNGFVDGGAAGGGGGGAAVYSSTTGTVTVNASLTGGIGGAGGLGGGATSKVNNTTYGGTGYGGGGGGGQGGAGIYSDLGGDILVGTTRVVRGGAGGVGGNASYGEAGDGGDGGAGVVISGQRILTNRGAILGGAGGAGGVTVRPVQNNLKGPNGTAGSTGVAVVGSGGVTLVNSGTIGNATGTTSIQFSGGGNTLSLESGSTILGNAVASTGAGTGDKLQLGGATNSTFAVSDIGAAAKYQNFTSFEKTGTGTWTLTGTTAGLTPWTVSQGVLSINADGALGSPSALTLNGGALITTANNFVSGRAITLGEAGGTLDFRNTLQTWNGVVSGPGSLTKTGSGTTELAGANTYTGATTVAAGTLRVTGSGSIADSSGVEVASGATFSIANSQAGVVNIQALTGAGAVALATRRLTLTDAEGIFSGVISGANGGVTVSKGTQTLTGANTYTGATEISTDGTLSLGNGGASGSIAGAVTNNGALIFNRSNGLSIGGLVSGTGALNQIGTGTTTLTAANTYTGATTVGNGTLALSGAGSIAASSSVAVGAAGNLSIALTTTGATVNSLTGLGNVALGNKSLTLNAVDDTFGGVISGSGSVALAKGTQTLTGANSYTGATNVYGTGTLLVDGSIGKGTVFVAGGGTLGGSGFIGGLVDVGNEGAGTLQGVAGDTLTMGALTLGKAAVVDAVLGSTGDNSLFQVNGAVTLGGTLNVAAGQDFGVGVYKLINYTGALTNNGLNVGTVPEGTDLYLQTSVANAVNVVNTTGQTLQFWDGDSVGGVNRNNNVIEGGNGTWTAASDNWTTADGSINAPMKPQPGFAIFQAAGGNVTVDGTDGGVAVTGMQFASDGYVVQGDAIALTPTDGNAVIRVGDGSGAVYTATIDSALTGAGRLEKTDNGTLVLNGANTYTGGTLVSGGVLQGNTTSLRGDIVDNANVTFAQAASGTFEGALSGNGSVRKTGTGTLTLEAANSYSGGTVIDGGTVATEVSGALGTGPVAVNAGGALALSGGFDAGNLAINVAARPVDNDINGGFLQFRDLSSAGNATVQNQGAVEFRDNATAGAAQIRNDNGGNTSFWESTTAGTATITAASGGSTDFLFNSTAGNARLVNEAGGTTEFWDSSTADNATVVNGAGGVVRIARLEADGISIGSLEGAGNVQIGNKALTTGGLGTSTTIAGVISGNGGSLSKTGAGTLTLSGENTYTGGTTVSAGTLQLGDGGTSGSIVGDVTNNANLAFNRSDAVTFAGVISGSGAVQQVGAGTTTLTAANSYAGGTTISAGTLQLGDGGTSGSILGDVVNNANLAFNRSDAVSFGGAISGSGAVQQAGSGTTTLTAANTYAGGTSISGGTLQLGNGGTSGSIIGDVTNNGNLAINRSDAITLAGAISGSGAVQQLGAGTTTLAGVNTYTGGTTISAGTLIGNAASFGTGAIANAGALILEQATDATFSNDLSGTGSLTKSGAATVYYTGNGTAFTGALDVTGGTLSVNSALNAAVRVEAGSTLKGTGSVGSTVVANGATVAPGNGIGTLTVNGNLTFGPGAFYHVETNPNGQSDRINVTGTATLGGASVIAIAADGNWGTTTRYTILTSGNRVGTFGGVSSNFAFLDPALSYEANNVVLTLNRNTVAFPAIGQTFNQRTTGAALEALGGGALYSAVVQLDAPTARSAFDQLSGELHASVRSSLMEDSRFIREAGIDRLRQAQGAATDLKTVEGMDGGAWARVYGSWGKMNGDGNAAKVDRNTSGILVGADRRVGDWRVGVMGGGGRSDVDVDARRSSAKIDNYHLGVYGGTEWGALALRTGASYSRHEIDTQRTVAFTGLAGSNEGNYNARTAQVFGELGWRIDAGRVALEPFANLAYASLKTDGFTEHGGITALSGRRKSSDTTFTTLGLRASTHLGEEANGTTLRGMLGWRHAFGDVSQSAVMAFAGGNGFQVAGVPIAKDAAVIEAGLDFAVQRDLTLGVSYVGQVGNGVKDHGVKASLLWKF